MTEWCILRTAGASTLGLARSLNDAGYEAWSPVEAQLKRNPHTRKREEAPAPMMPSFVFAGSDRMIDLVMLSRSPALNYQVWDSTLRRMVTKGHPHFSVFRDMGRYATVTDRALAPLRLAEQRTRPKAEQRSYAKGERVRLVEGGFAGLDGTVEGEQGNYTMVRFPGFPIAVKISTWLLFKGLDEESPVKICDSQTEQALCAKAA